MKKNIYTLISYKEGSPGYYDRYGDLRSEKDAEFEILYLHNQEDAAQALGNAQFKNSGGSITFLINGINPDDCEYLKKDDFYLYNEIKSLFFDIDNCAFSIRIGLEKKQEELDKLEKLKLDELMKLKEIQQQKQIEDKEKEQLLLLLKKYGYK